MFDDILRAMRLPLNINIQSPKSSNQIKSSALAELNQKFKAAALNVARSFLRDRWIKQHHASAGKRFESVNVDWISLIAETT